MSIDGVATDSLPLVQVGDMLGFETTATGASVGYENRVDGTDPVEFQYAGAGTTVEGDILVVADGGTGRTRRHHVKAVVSQPAVVSFEYVFSDFGDFSVDAVITNPLTPLTVSTSVGVQSRVLGKYDQPISRKTVSK